MEKITMAHGSGGESTGKLINDLFAKEFRNEYLAQMEDSTIVPQGSIGTRLAVTTDSFVVTPVEYPGGDIGRLSVCGTVNDLLMSGAVPEYLTCGFILEEGLPLDQLKRIVHSMAATADEAGIKIVAGDTKVVENHSGPDGGLLINTAGIGFLPADAPVLSPAGLRDGDRVIVSGNLGDHHATILGRRMNLENRFQSDNAPLVGMVRALEQSEVRIHEMRDVTRGGLATVLNEFAEASGCIITLDQEALPVSSDVRAFCGMLGLDPIYMGNEGKMVCIVDGRDADQALDIIRTGRYGENAAIIGSVRNPDSSAHEKPALLMKTPIGGIRIIGPLYGEGLPRIC